MNTRKKISTHPDDRARTRPWAFARPTGWALTAIAFLLAYLGQARVFDDSGACPWVLVAGTVIIALAVIILGTRSRRHDLLAAGVLAFISPAIALLAF